MKLSLPSLAQIAAGPEEVVCTDASVLTVENLVTAYRSGVFPWPDEPDEPIPWCCPRVRALLVFDELTPGRTLEKRLRRDACTYSIDRAFDQVVAACAAAPRAGGFGTWISPTMLAAYTALHRAGFAHSVEVWDAHGQLVGGLYGVDAGGVFCGESMFHLTANASKLAILHLAKHLCSRGATWMDIQQLTPHMARLGAREVPRDLFLKLLAKDLRAGRKLFGMP